MEKKYVLEVAREGYYLGWAVEKRMLFNTYQEAKEKFDEILKNNYSSEDLYNDAIIEECLDKYFPECDYVYTWADTELDIALFIYEVEDYPKGR